MAMKDFEGKKVFLQIKTIEGNRRYSGVVEEVTFMGKNIDSEQVYFIMLIDKFGQKVGFTSSQIIFIEEEK